MEMPMRLFTSLILLFVVLGGCGGAEEDRVWIKVKVNEEKEAKASWYMGSMENAYFSDYIAGKFRGRFICLNDTCWWTDNKEGALTKWRVAKQADKSDSGQLYLRYDAIVSFIVLKGDPADIVLYHDSEGNEVPKPEAGETPIDPANL